MGRKNKTRSVPTPKVGAAKTSLPPAYSPGEQGLTFREIGEQPPVFSFRYLSLGKSNRCFNGTEVATRDFIALFEKLKSISAKSYRELSVNPYFRFHRIDLKDPRVCLSQTEYIRMLTKQPDKFDPDQAPPLYQFDAFKEARCAGFLYMGVFYLIWLDRGHNIYKRK